MRPSSMLRGWLVGLLITSSGTPVPSLAESGDPLAEVFAAAGARDCARLGDIVNDGIERRAVPLLYVAGLMFDEGLCVDADPVRSKTFYDAAAATGDRSAAIRIGLHYALGDGLPRSYALAGRWLLHAQALELRALEQAAEGVVAGERLRSLRDLPGLPAHMHALPPAESGWKAEWSGYLHSVHFLASRLMKYPRSALQAGVEASYHVESCPAQQAIEVKRLRISSPTPSADRFSADRALRDEIERAYRRAQDMLARPVAAPTKGGCLAAPVEFKIR